MTLDEMIFNPFKGKIKVLHCFRVLFATSDMQQKKRKLL